MIHPHLTKGVKSSPFFPDESKITNSNQLPNLEASKDLTRTYCVVDMDMFYAAVPCLDSKKKCLNDLGRHSKGCNQKYLSRMLHVWNMYPHLPWKPTKRRYSYTVEGACAFDTFVWENVLYIIHWIQIQSCWKWAIGDLGSFGWSNLFIRKHGYDMRWLTINGLNSLVWWSALSNILSSHLTKTWLRGLFQYFFERIFSPFSLGRFAPPILRNIVQGGWNHHLAGYFIYIRGPWPYMIHRHIFWVWE